jgi:hypothetical protein
MKIKDKDMNKECSMSGNPRARISLPYIKELMKEDPTYSLPCEGGDCGCEDCFIDWLIEKSRMMGEAQ